MKLRVKRRVARAALWGGIASGVLIAAGGIITALTRQGFITLSWAILWWLGGLAIAAAVSAMARLWLRRDAEIDGLAWWLAILRFAVNFAGMTAVAILLLAWLAATIAGASAALGLFQAMVLTVAGSAVTTLSLGVALDLALLLRPTPEKPAAD